MSDLYIGLMSGTSADGIDATLSEISETNINVIAHLEVPHPQSLRQQIIDLCAPGDNEIERLGRLDQQLGRAFADAANALLDRAKVTPEQVTAIGSHGQTIRHRPNGDDKFTLQIADPNQIAQGTSITTVADFRRRDMAVGGEGAPLAPAFHQAAFSCEGKNRVVVNIGGISNVTLLEGKQLTAGFDTGPGNGLMDGWIKRHKQVNYDHNGDWAYQGRVDTPLLQQLLQHPFLSKASPKSTGREDFHLDWLDGQLNTLDYPPSPVDVQATLLEYTAQTIHQQIEQMNKAIDDIYICGGGALNKALMTRLQQLSRCSLTDTSAMGVEPQQVEGAAFGWLAHQTLARASGNCPAVTGAQRAVILGGIYYA
ncbi:MAG: anhydro-N-acetylmuramic acid kinase [Cellvibrionaceae bacterium]|nr:anhydro-N-acetylmuramic acid kinase [Cellvibrionaceae bacterium]|tara:strand:+ start:3208 stop:4311 length:1104 start_codon:yes stop_codon:yes gene_type:complete